MIGEFKNDTPVPETEVKWIFKLEKAEEELLMTKFEESCQEPCDVASQVKHDIYRDLIVRFFQEKLRVELGKLFDDKVAKWKKDNEWVKKCRECKIVKIELYLANDLVSKAEDVAKLHGFKTSTVDVVIGEEDFDFVNKSFKETKLGLKYSAGINKNEYSSFEFGRSFVEIQFKYSLT